MIMGSVTQPMISIIIPCFNSGIYLPEALDSIRGIQDKSSYEVIIVNDGSTDQHTLQLLDRLQTEGYTVLHQENKGPAGARNAGINFSRSKYLFFLDSDNKIRNSYLDKGIAILNTFENVGIVYGNPFFFGESPIARFTPGNFDMLKLLVANYIDMCTIIRRKVFDEVGGFDEERTIVGHEDWEFWIRANTAGWQFHYINEILFDYRVTSSSLITDATHPEKFQQMQRYIYSKHVDIFVSYYKDLYLQYLYYQHDKKNPFRSFFKFLHLRLFTRSA